MARLMVVLLFLPGTLASQDPGKIVKVDRQFPCRDFLTRADVVWLGFSDASPHQCCRIHKHDELEKDTVYLIPVHQWRVDHPDWLPQIAVQVQIKIWDRADRAEQFRRTQEQITESQAKNPRSSTDWARVENYGTTRMYLNNHRGISLLFYLDVYQVSLFAERKPDPRPVESESSSPEAPPRTSRKPVRPPEEENVRNVAHLVHDKLTGKYRPPKTSTDKAGAIRRWHKGTFDLARTAEELHKHFAREFVWTTKRSPEKSFSAIKSFEDWDACRQMSCFEFVHYVAYICSKHPVNVTGEGEHPLSHAAEKNMSASKMVWDRKSEIPRGKVVFGVGWTDNNAGGFFHVGISLGDGKVISLRGGDSGENLRIENTEEVFSRGYREVYYGEYNWGHLK